MGRCIPVYRIGTFFVPEFHTDTYQYILYPFIFLYVADGILVSPLRNISPLINFHFEHWIILLKILHTAGNKVRKINRSNGWQCSKCLNLKNYRNIWLKLCGTQGSTAFTRTHNWTWFCTRRIQSTFLHPISWISISILSSKCFNSFQGKYYEISA
jgi:tRNA U38,U39,U40 pseudouridine synthase TruA